MVFLFGMCLNHAINKPRNDKKNHFFKTVIFIAVLFSCSMVSAQEYNNWLMGGGAVLNFDTSPATMICGNDNDEEPERHTVMLSDDNGKMILFGYKIKPSANANNSLSDFVIRNKYNQTIVSINCADLRNVIGCRLPQGGYCIAAVVRHQFDGELHVFQFNKDGELENESVYNDGNYTFFIDFLHFDDFIVLLAYKNGIIETYKLTSDGCNLWTSNNMMLDVMFSHLTVPWFDIEHSLDNSTIIVTSFYKVYTINFDKYSGRLGITDEKTNDKLRVFAFSKSDKYFLIIDNFNLKGFLYDNDFDFNFDNPDMVYDLLHESDFVCNECWEMAIGVDGKIYVHHQTTDYIIVLDGIEEGNITEDVIQSECLKTAFFPRIPRMADYPSCRVSAAFDNVIVCNGQPLNILLSGNAPFEVFYKIDGEEHRIKTSEPSYQLPNVAGKYQITKIIDASCEAVPTVNNAAEIAQKMKALRIVEE